MKQASEQMANAKNLSEDNKFGQNNAKIMAATSAALDAVTQGFAAAKASGKSDVIEKAAAAAIEVGNTAQTQIQAGAEAGVKFSTDKQVLGKIASLTTGVSGDLSLKGSTAATAASALQKKASDTEAFKTAQDLKESQSLSEGGSRNLSDGRTNTNQSGESRDRSYTVAQQVQMSQAFGTTANSTRQVADNLSATASEAVQSSQAIRYSDYDQANNDRVGGTGPGGVEARAAAIGAGVRSELNDNQQLQSMTDQAKLDIAASPAQRAQGMVDSHPLHTGAPSAPVSASGVNVGNALAAGQATTASAIAEVNAPIAAQKEELSAEFQNRKDTGAAAFGVEQIGEKIGGVVDQLNGAQPGGGNTAAPRPGRAGRE